MSTLPWFVVVESMFLGGKLRAAENASCRLLAQFGEVESKALVLWTLFLSKKKLGDFDC